MTDTRYQELVARAELLEAAKVALNEMCRTVAPRDSFTDAVDRLDAAIAAQPEPRGERPLNEIEVGVLLRGLGGSSTDALWLTEQLNKLIEAHRAERAPEPRYQGLLHLLDGLPRWALTTADDTVRHTVGFMGDGTYIRLDAAKNAIEWALRLAAAEARGTQEEGKCSK